MANFRPELGPGTAFSKKAVFFAPDCPFSKNPDAGAAGLIGPEEVEKRPFFSIYCTFSKNPEEWARIERVPIEVD